MCGGDRARGSKAMGLWKMAAKKAAASAAEQLEDDLLADDPQARTRVCVFKLYNYIKIY